MPRKEKEEPKPFETLFQTAIIMHSMGKNDLAQPLIEKALELEPNNLDALKIAGLVSIALVQIDEAISYFDRMLEIDPKNEVALITKSVAYMATGNYEKVIEASIKAMEVYPNNSDAYVPYGSALMNLGRFDEALDTFNKMLSMSPGNVDAINFKAEIYAKSGKLETALQTYTFLLEKAPKRKSAWYQMGRINETLNNPQDALDAYENYLGSFNTYGDISRDNTGILALYRKGFLLVELGESDKALRVAKNLLNMVSDSATAYYIAAIAEAKRGKTSRSLKNLKKCIEINVDYKKEATTDKNFEKIKDLAEFKSLIM